MITRAAVVAAVMLCGAGYVHSATSASQVPTHEPLATFPIALEEWTGREEWPIEARVLHVLGVDDYLNRAYRASDGSTATLYVGYFAQQAVGDNIHSPMKCLPGAGWEPQHAERLRLAVEGRDIVVARVVIAKGLERMLVLYWYQSRERVIAGDYLAKVYKFIDAVTLNRTDGALVRIITPIADESAGAERNAEARASRFARIVLPVLTPHIGGMAPRGGSS